MQPGLIAEENSPPAVRPSLAPRPVRLLLINQDNFFAGMPGVEADWLPTGKSITPLAGPYSRAHGTPLRRIVGRLLTRRYDWVVLPAVDLRWPHDTGTAKRLVRRLVRGLLGFRLVARPFKWLVFGRRKVAVLDRYDSTRILSDFRAALRPDLYFKTNLEQAAADRDPALRFLPYWIFCSRYADPGPAAKDIDLIFAGALNSQQRERAVAQLDQLGRDGYAVTILRQPVPLDEYFRLLARSWLVVSPEGYGYHCFRHCEAMFAGSVPLINRPETPLVTDLVDGQNCFLYDRDGDGLRRKAIEVLARKEQVREMGARLREYALGRHAVQSVGRTLLEHLHGA